MTDVESLSASELEHLLTIKRQQEREEAEERTARLAELYEKPALGAYRKGREKAPTEAGA